MPAAGGLSDCSTAPAPPIPESRRVHDTEVIAMKASVYDNGPGLAGDAGSRFWYLLRQDAARRSLRWSLPIALLIGLLLRAVAGADLYDWDKLPIYKHHHELMYLLIQMWLALLFAVIVAHFNSRCSSLSLGLPIRPRELWLVRIVAISAAGILPLAVIVLMISVYSRGNLVEPALVRIGARIASAIVLSVVLFQVPDRGLYRIRTTTRFKWYVAGVTAGLMFYVTVTPESWIYTAVLLAAAAVITGVSYREMPPGFQTSCMETVRPRADAAGPVSRGQWRASSRLARRWRMVRLVLRETVNSWSGWLMILLIAVTVWALLAQYYAAYHSLQDYVILMLWIWILLNRSTMRLARFDSYPISRRLVFWVVMAVVAVAIGVGLTIGYTIHHASKDPVTQVRGTKGQVRVPFEAWEVSWNGKPPDAKSPWGESHEPGGMCLFGKDSRICVYNPYEIGGKSSSEFIAWQIDRAVERVHGADETVSGLSDAGVDSLSSRFLESEKYIVSSSLYRGSSMRMRTNALILTLWAVMFALLAGVWWRRFRPSADYTATRWFVILFFSLPYLYLFVLLALDARGLIEVDAALALTMIGLRWVTESIPLGLAGWVVVAVLACTASLWYVQSCFVRAEATSECERKTLLSEY
jgi:hypothetical protein